MVLFLVLKSQDNLLHFLFNIELYALISKEKIFKNSNLFKISLLPTLFSLVNNSNYHGVMEPLLPIILVLFLSLLNEHPIDEINPLEK